MKWWYSLHGYTFGDTDSDGNAVFVRDGYPDVTVDPLTGDIIREAPPVVSDDQAAFDFGFNNTQEGRA